MKIERFERDFYKQIFTCFDISGPTSTNTILKDKKNNILRRILTGNVERGKKRSNLALRKKNVPLIVQSQMLQVVPKS